MSFDLSSINVDEMTIEDIDNLLPQLSVELEKAKISRPIHEDVDEEFSKIWDEVESKYVKEFEKALEVEKERFIFNQGLLIVLEGAIGPTYAKEFFDTANECIRAKDFSKRFKFLRKINNPETLEVVKAGFAIYRLHISNSTGTRRGSSFVGTNRKSVKEDILRFRRSENSKVQAVIANVERIGIFPA